MIHDPPIKHLIIASVKRSTYPKTNQIIIDVKLGEVTVSAG